MYVEDALDVFGAWALCWGLLKTAEEISANFLHKRCILLANNDNFRLFATFRVRVHQAT
jgi:hypothetical protein